MPLLARAWTGAARARRQLRRSWDPIDPAELLRVEPFLATAMADPR